MKKYRDRVNQDAHETADDGAVDPDELQVTAHVQLDPLRRLLAVPALDGVRDDRGELGAVRTRLMQEMQAFADRLGGDEELRQRLDAMAGDLAVFAVDRYGAELTAVITHTIERWDGKQAAERIELHVGRDLQFIRINGTIVGGLVGVLIHTIAVLIH